MLQQHIFVPQVVWISSFGIGRIVLARADLNESGHLPKSKSFAGRIIVGDTTPVIHKKRFRFSPVVCGSERELLRGRAPAHI